MRYLLVAALLLLCLGSMAQATTYTWNFTNAADYWTNNAVVTALPSGGNAYVAPLVEDEAAVFARLNTQAYHLAVGNITGGKFTLSGMNNPAAVYGSLYLSPTGGSGSTVMINMSPMGRTGSGGAYVYTFDRDTAADVKLRDGPGGDWGLAHYTGSFGGAINWVNANAPGNYAAFFGPQIGMSGTSGTTFTVSQIQLSDTAFNWTGATPLVYDGIGHSNTAVYFDPNGAGTTITGTIDLTNVGIGNVLMFGLVDKKLVDTGGYDWQSGAYIYLYKKATGTLGLRIGPSDGNLGGSVGGPPGGNCIYVDYRDSIDFVLHVHGGTIDVTSSAFSGTQSWTYGAIKTLNNAYGYAWNEFQYGAYLGYSAWIGTGRSAGFNVNAETPANVVSLVPRAIYLHTNDTIIVDLNVAKLMQPVSGLRALLNYSSSFFDSLTLAPGGGTVWDDPMLEVLTPTGDFNVDAIVKVGVSGVATQVDATTAKIGLRAISQGKTKLVFRADGVGPENSTVLVLPPVGTEYNVAYPVKVDTTDIYIDDAAPTITTVPADGTSNPVTAATQTITGTVSDVISGIDTLVYSLNGAPPQAVTVTAGAFSQTIVLVPGGNTVVFTVTDKCGNFATSTIGYTYTQPAPGIGLYASLAPNVYAAPASSWNAWKVNAFNSIFNGTTGAPIGTTPYNTFQDLGFANTLDYSTCIVTTGSSTWLGLVAPGGTNEWGTAVQFAYKIDNGIVGNPGAAKLDLNYVTGTYRFYYQTSSPDNFDSYASLAGKTFGGDVSWKGYNYSGSTWTEVTSGSVADMIICVKNRAAMACGPLQADMDALYAELSGSTGDKFLYTLYGINYSGQAGVDNASTGVKTLNFGPVNDTTEPLVAITSPTDGLKTNVAALTVRGTASDPEPLASGLKSVTVNGITAAISGGTWSVDLTLVEGSNTITAVAEDYAGNTDSAAITVVLDRVAPTIDITDDLGGNPVLQGTYTVTVTAGDTVPSSGLVVPPVVKLDTNVLTAATGTGNGPWTYTIVVNEFTTNTAHLITADISDLAGNPADQATRSFTVNKNEIKGIITSDFVGAGTRLVTFVLNGSTTMTANVGASGVYKLTNVIDGVTAVSAKTAWTLRQKLDPLASPNGQTVANFTLLGGDLNNNNSVNVFDYAILKANWLLPTPNPAADITGDGAVNITDYNIMKLNWFKAGSLLP